MCARDRTVIFRKFRDYCEFMKDRGLKWKIQKLGLGHNTGLDELGLRTGLDELGWTGLNELQHVTICLG